jgi:CRP/FNR family cyclic AMP-dependent transcriptional regulator
MAKVPEFLVNVAIFQDLDDKALYTLIPLLISKRIKAGSIVFREMDESDALYIVEDGTIVVSKHVHGDVDIVLARFERGDFFGEMGLFDGAPRSASAHAEVDTTLWTLKRDTFQHILTVHSEIAAKICYRMVTIFIQRLRATNEQAREAVRWGLEVTGYSPAEEFALLGRRST